jgi:hypothetical protein
VRTFRMAHPQHGRGGKPGGTGRLGLQTLSAAIQSYHAPRRGTTLPSPAGALAQKSAQASIKRRRFSNMSPRR